MDENKKQSLLGKAHKFKSLKVYSSTEFLADSKKKYQTVFESSETGYIYCELSFYNKLFDEEPWSTNIRLECAELDENLQEKRIVCEIKVQKEVKISENIVYIREGWGNATPGVFWSKGKYQWKAYMDDDFVGSKLMYIEKGGPVDELQNPYFNIESLQLYEGPASTTPLSERKYFSTFASKETRYIWSELSIKNLQPYETWYCEVFFYYYNDARQLKGSTTEVVCLMEGQDKVQITSGWGSNSKGTWHDDQYTLEIVFMNELQAVVAFECGEEFIEGFPKSLISLEGVINLAETEENEETLEEVLEEFNRLIGLESVKTKISDYIQYLKFLQVRNDKGFNDTQKLNLHAVFTGNPGTGKTTVAKRLGKIYKKMGLLSKGHVHEVDRADLVGEFIGQTAPKVKDAVKKARGGILFIDEAYALARSGNNDKDYGREVIEILIKEMSDGPGDIAVIAAGYPQEMQVFLESNPGLKSRFNMHYEFVDYLPEELMGIADYAMEDRDVELSAESREFLTQKIIEAYRTRGRSFGNARYVNSLIDEAKMNLGLRVMKTENPSELSKEMLSVIELPDLEKIFGKQEKRLVDIPVDEELLNDSLADLKALIGMENIKNEVNELVKLVKFYRETGKDVLNTFSLHTIFTGNPGTGKTTIARILAQIFKALGILEKGHIVECDRGDLVAGFIGQTAIKTTAKIEEAQGGVLFVDEAYALSQGTSGNDFGKEAIETILKKMEDLRGKFIVIAAGYPDNMKQFLESNPGLSSRFDKHLHFEDYNGEDLYKICLQMLKGNHLTPDKEAEKHLINYLKFLHANKDKFFGNARSVRKVVEEAVKNQHLRLAKVNSDKRTPKMLSTLVLQDVEEFQTDKFSIFKRGRTPIGFGSSASKEDISPEPPE